MGRRKAGCSLFWAWRKAAFNWKYNVLSYLCLPVRPPLHSPPPMLAAQQIRALVTRYRVDR